jgi:O-antigen/teichoic acid export membrane protein
MSPASKISSSTSSIRRAVAGGLLFNLLVNVFLYIGQLIIARRLPRNDYAVFTVVISFISLMALFADLGLTLLFVRKFAEADEHSRAGVQDVRGELLGSMLGLRIGLSVLVCITVWIIAPVLGYPYETQKLMHIMLLTLFISSRLLVVRSVGEAFLRGHNKYNLVMSFILIDALTFAVALYFYGGGNLDLEGAIWIYTLCHIPGFILLIGFIATHTREMGFRISFHFGVLKQMIREGFPLILSTTFLTIHNFSDALLLDKLSSPTQVSAYGAGMRILTAIMFLPAVFSAVIAPRVTQAITRKDTVQVKKIVQMTVRFLFLFTSLTALVITTAPKLIISLLFGSDKYGDIIPVITAYGWSFIPIALATFLTEIAVAEGTLWVSTIYMMTIMILSITADLLIIPLWGAFGAALAKCISVFIGLMILLLITRRLQVLDFRKLLKFFGVALIPLIVSLAASIFFSNQTSLSEVFVAMIVGLTFLLLTFITRTLTWADIGILLKGNTP